MHTSLPGWLNEIIIADRIQVREDCFLEDLHLEKKAHDFEAEWQEHRNQKMTRTWGFEAKQRLDQLFLETNTSAEELSKLIVLDAGCGNGLLTEAIADTGSRVIGVDVISNLHAITKEYKKKDNLFFLRANIQNLPLKENSFDLIVSNGVLHHTPNTKDSFLKLAKLVKTQGKLYIWLYKKPFRFKNKFFLFVSDSCRIIISRLPAGMQKPIVRGIASTVHFTNRIRRKPREYTDLLIDMYDSLTPLYRHYHSPIEVAGWFYEAGFSSPVLSHWDNSFGFGMCAQKTGETTETAGENYGREDRDARLHLS